jgi:hypothetical protein
MTERRKDGREGGTKGKKEVSKEGKSIEGRKER